jgi:UDP-4-amino-4,6-dideoxy-N-acetyl-beta-L-altrosamine transaminase
MPEAFLPYGRQCVDDEDIAAVAAVLRSDYLTAGPAVSAFEEDFAAKVGARYAVACANGTAALHLSMLALGIGANDKVVVPTLTFLATANAARYVGAHVVFADVDATTGLMRDAELDQAIVAAKEAGVRAVIPVHLNGQCVDLERLSKAAHFHGLRVVEDACHALGGSYRTAAGETVAIGSCKHSDLTVFSMHPVKVIAMGEGGVITTNDDGLNRRLRFFRGHGMVHDASAFTEFDQAFAPGGGANPWYYEMPEPGFNYRASDIHCALGRSQLRKLDRFVAVRRELVAAYDQQLATLAPVIKPIAREPDCDAAWHLYVVQIEFASAGISRASLMRRLRERGIGTQVHYLPVHRQPYYRRIYGDISLPGADAYYERALSLPLFPTMKPHDVRRVVGELETLVAKVPA